MLRIALALVLAACSGEHVEGRLRGHANGALSVLTYNVNFERSTGELANETARAIARADADLVFLQETHEEWESVLRESLGDRYPHVSFRHAEAEGGLAILSRHPFREVHYGTAPEGRFPAWCGIVSAPFAELAVLNVHLRPPLDEEGRLVFGFFTTGPARHAELRHHLRCFDRAPDLVAGDFNEGEGEAIDHLRSLGLRDAQEARPPLERTWTWQTEWTELEGRPDHVFAGRRLVVRGVQVIQEGASDHRPLRVILSPRERNP